MPGTIELQAQAFVALATLACQAADCWMLLCRASNATHLHQPAPLQQALGLLSGLTSA